MRISALVLAAPILHSALAVPTHSANSGLTPGGVSLDVSPGSLVHRQEDYAESVCENENVSCDAMSDRSVIVPVEGTPSLLDGVSADDTSNPLSVDTLHPPQARRGLRAKCREYVDADEEDIPEECKDLIASAKQSQIDNRSVGVPTTDVASNGLLDKVKSFFAGSAVHRTVSDLEGNPDIASVVGQVVSDSLVKGKGVKFLPTRQVKEDDMYTEMEDPEDSDDDIYIPPTKRAVAGSTSDVDERPEGNNEAYDEENTDVEMPPAKRGLDILQSSAPWQSSILSAQILAIAHPLSQQTADGDLETGLDMIIAALQGKTDKLQLNDASSAIDTSKFDFASEQGKGQITDISLIIATCQGLAGRLSPEQTANPDIYKRLCALDVILDQYLNLLDDKTTDLLVNLGPVLCTLGVALHPVLDALACTLGSVMASCLGDSVLATTGATFSQLKDTGSSGNILGSDGILGVVA